MILDAYGRPVRQANGLEVPTWLERETVAILAGRLGGVKQMLEDERVEALRASVAAERSTPAAEQPKLGLGVRFIKAWDLVKSERLP